MSSTRISGFYKLTVQERIQALGSHGLLDDESIKALDSGSHTLRPHVADHMIENVVGVLGLPLGVGLNFQINNRDYVVPLAVEEPSIVAGLSGAARTALKGGGYTATTTDPILIGQVQIDDIDDVDKAKEALLKSRDEIIGLANSIHPNMKARGGGVNDIEIHTRYLGSSNRPNLVLHLLVNTCDAMGANVVNSMCEGVAGLAESLTGGQVFLRILSNLTDRAIVNASCRIPISELETKGFTGDQVCDGIVVASEFALADPYRAVTHNKGIMNGVDAVAIATGNDFRAIEAAAHAYAARDGQYRALTKWTRSADDHLVGEIEIPMKVGTVGGSLETNPTVKINHDLLGRPSAVELACIMGVVGLAQNYAALRSLSTAGIQKHHMTLHARSVASTAKVPDHHFEEVVAALIESNEIKVWKAEEILAAIQSRDAASAPAEEQEHRASSSGKVILLGEHAVVYGHPALAAPIPLAVEASVKHTNSQSSLVVSRWNLSEPIAALRENPTGMSAIVAKILDELQLTEESLEIEVFPNVPRGMGLGSSASVAVAVIRALSESFKLGLSDEKINSLAFACEQISHGNPSGVDNTLATYGKLMLYQRDGETSFKREDIEVAKPIPMVVGVTGREGETSQMVASVAAGRTKFKSQYDSFMAQIGDLSSAGAEAIRSGELVDLGQLMNMCHGLLNALQLSTPELEELVMIARNNGALGAKLTGGGGGGSVIAVCPDNQDRIVNAMSAAGYDAFAFNLE